MSTRKTHNTIAMLVDLYGGLLEDLEKQVTGMKAVVVQHQHDRAKSEADRAKVEQGYVEQIARLTQQQIEKQAAWSKERDEWVAAVKKRDEELVSAANPRRAVGGS